MGSEIWNLHSTCQINLVHTTIMYPSKQTKHQFYVSDTYYLWTQAKLTTIPRFPNVSDGGGFVYSIDSKDD